MTWMYSFPMRYSFPVLFGSFAVFMCLFAYLIMRPLVIKEVDRNAEHRMRTTLTEAQGALEHLWRANDISGIRSYIATFGTERSQIRATLISPDKIVLASINLSEIDKPANEICPDIAKDIVSAFEQANGTIVKLSHNGLSVVGCAPIYAPEKKYLRGQNRGFLFFKRSLIMDTDTALSLLRQQAISVGIGMLLTSILFIWIFHITWGSRAKILVTSAQSVEKGDFSVRTQIKGRDEFALIGNAFDSMLDTLDSNQTTLLLRDKAISDTKNGIIIVDANSFDQPIIYCNAAFEKITGYSSDEALGQNCRFLQGVDVDQPELKIIRKTIENCESCQVTLRNYRKDGALFWNDLSISPVSFNEGNVTHFIGIQNDITNRKIAEDRLSSFGKVFELLTNEIFMIDEKSLRFVHVNQSGFSNLGYSEDEMATLTMLDIMPEISLDQFEKIVRPIRENLRSRIDFSSSLQRKDRSLYPVDIHLQCAKFDGTDIFTVVMLDVSDRMQTEKDLAQAHLLLESAPDASIIVNSNGAIVIANSRTSSMFGYPPKELIGLSIEQLIPSSFREKHKIYRNQYVLEPHIRDMGIGLDLFALTKSGAEIPIEVSLSPIETVEEMFVAVAIRDVTARKKVEQTLQKSEERYRDIFNNAQELIQSITPEGSFKYVNPAWHRIFGYSREEINELNWHDIVHPEDRARFKHHITELLSGEPINNIIVNCLTKTNMVVSLEGSITTNFSEESSVELLAIFHDITSRVEAEYILEQAKMAAEKATMVKSRFMAAASHDLRQPLQSIELYLASLNMLLTQSQPKEIVDKMRQSINLMSELLDVLLDITKFDSGSISANEKSFPIQHSIDQLSGNYKIAATEKSLTFDCPDVQFKVYTDPLLLQRILDNFVSNAIRYTERGGIQIRCIPSDSYLRIEIHDTGVGMPENSLDTIFEEYYQLDNEARDSNRGLGLGLSIVKHIATLLALELDVKSTLDAGSVFTVIVPLSNLIDKPTQLNNKADTPKQELKNTKVLFVDDNPNIVNAIKTLLEMKGMKVFTATNGEQALELINSGVCPNIIISDYRMPDLSGVDVIQKIRKTTRNDLPAILITGDTSSSTLYSIDLPNCTILQKPVGTEQLISYIEMAVVGFIAE